MRAATAVSRSVAMPRCPFSLRPPFTVDRLMLVCGRRPHVYMAADCRGRLAVHAGGHGPGGAVLFRGGFCRAAVAMARFSARSAHPAADRGAGNAEDARQPRTGSLSRREGQA